MTRLEGWRVNMHQQSMAVMNIYLNEENFQYSWYRTGKSRRRRAADANHFNQYGFNNISNIVMKIIA